MGGTEKRARDKIADAKREALLAIPQLVRLGRDDEIEVMRWRARRAQTALNGHFRDLDYDRLAADRLEDEAGYLRDSGGHYGRVQRGLADAGLPVKPRRLRLDPDPRLTTDPAMYEGDIRWCMGQSDLFSTGGRKSRSVASSDEQRLRPSSRSATAELSSEGARRQDFLDTGGWVPFEPDTTGMPVGRPPNELLDEDAAHALINERITSVASKAGFVIDVDAFAPTLTKRGRPTAAHDAGRTVFAWVVAKADVTGPALVGYLGRFGISERTAYRLHKRGVELIDSEIPVRVRALSSHVPGVRARTPGPCPPFLIQLEEPSN